MSFVPTVTLTSSDLQLRVAIDSGARVIALVDRHTGRNWLAEGAPPPEATREVYGLDEAAGWDECFPTMAPCDACATPWQRELRDHGELWGRPSTVTAQSDDVLETTFARDGFRFVRRLSLTGPVLQIDYGVETNLSEPTPFLWAMHPLFALRRGESIAFDGAKTLLPTYLALDGGRLEPGALPWPSADGRIPFRLDRVQDFGARFAGKFFVHEADVRRASLGGPQRWLDMEWDGIGHVGLWLSYGAWPDFNEVVHVAVEPTTSPDDRLTDAIAKARAALVAPGERKSWRVRMILRSV